MRAIASRFWMRAGAILAVVTVGGSQILFNLIRSNPDHFPRAAGFHAWVLVWAQLLPFALLFALDTLVHRAAPEGSRGRRLWRSSLYALAALLFLRQLRVGPLGNVDLLPAWLEAAILAAAVGGVGLLSFRRSREADRYVAVLGLLGLLLGAQYAWGTLRPGSAAAEVAATPPAPGRPVVLVLFDELCLDVLLKDGAIDRERFPRLAALADEAAWFPNATSNFDRTEPSVLAMLTGRLHPSDGERLLFDRLRDTHRTTALVAWPGLCRWLAARAGPGDRHISRTDADALKMGPLETLQFVGAALSDSPFVRQPIGPPVRESFATPDLWDIWTSRDVLGAEIDSVLSLLDSEAGPGRLLYWHCSLPHAPFQYDAEGRRHGRGDDLFRRGRDPKAVWENYREQARGVDRVVGMIVDRLKSRGLYDEAILIVTSDHGLRSGGDLEPEGYPELRSGLEVRIPFLVRGPSVRPGVHEADYQNVDFLPTLLELLGQPAEQGELEGISVFARERPSRDKRFFSGAREYVLDRGSGLWRRRNGR